ncbi:MAG: HNH endonuclease [Thermomicrobiales bacterium]|nr:HNH endonuclease [Thermomicrobiales bacterium]
MPGCRSPYLEWHHFDPPWRDRQHHESAGMVALCREHHAKADAGAFTVEQLRELKKSQREPISGSFDWLRHELLAVVGGNFYLDTLIAVQIGERPVIFLRRDGDGYMRLNIDMPSLAGRPRMKMEDSWWITAGDEADVECPPSGRLVSASYPNGDRLKVEFFEFDEPVAFDKRYPVDQRPPDWIQPQPPPGFELPEPEPNSRRMLGLGGQFPITTVEVEMKLAGAPFDLGRRGSTICGLSMSGTWASGCEVGVRLG